MKKAILSQVLPSQKIDVCEEGYASKKGWMRCEIGKNLKFLSDGLETYCFAPWQPVIFDALLLAATVDFADKILARPPRGWGRNFVIRVPVHDPSHWNAKAVSDSLHDALNFLTGDKWDITFVQRKKSAVSPQQKHFNFSTSAKAVMAFSDGMDSQAVAGIKELELKDGLIRVRVGTKKSDRPVARDSLRPFTSVPYKVNTGNRNDESSARSRGFKFALISGVAAYLVDAPEVIVPESGQGSLGPVLIPVSHAYKDYRNHPVFTEKMSKFLEALLHKKIKYVFPRLWYTKGETLSEFVRNGSDGSQWSETWSCWQQNRNSSVDGKRRHCGICAACMLRRLSVHAAGLTESPDRYIWEDLSANSFEAGASKNFDKFTSALEEYAIAGTLHFDHLASLRKSPHYGYTKKQNALMLAEPLGLPSSEIELNLDTLLQKHEKEWEGFIKSLGSGSFINRWVYTAP